MSLRIVIDQPAEQCFGANDVFIGPTAVDLSPITEAARLAAIRQSEAQMLREYRRRDLAHYSHQTQRARWRKH